MQPFWFRHFGYLPYQRFWEFVEALRKGGHLMGYGLVCVAFFGTSYWWLVRRAHFPDGWVLKNRAAGWALVLTMLLGSVDQIHQRFVPQRTSTITDVGFDLCGGYFSLMALFAFLRLRDRKSAPKSPPIRLLARTLLLVAMSVPIISPQKEKYNNLPYKPP